MSWSDVSSDKRLDLLRRRNDGEPIRKLAAEVGMRPQTLARRLRELQEYGEIAVNPPVVEQPPTYDEIFQWLKKEPRSIIDLADKLGVPPSDARDFIQEMVSAGYRVRQTKRTAEVDRDPRSNADILPETLLDQPGRDVIFAVVSDTHAGSAYAQPTNLNRFLDEAYDWGVRHVFIPGDVSAGVLGYRGQELDLVPDARPLSRSKAFVTTNKQIWLADHYLPKKPGLTYYVLGGNHDWWHVINTGIDLVRQLANMRDDIYYLGYDVFDLPLTPTVSARLWHPTGGVPYALSYRTQKALENMAFEELYSAVSHGMNSTLRFLFAGHMHIEVKFNRGPFLAAQVGCFEGQTNYLKRKGLFPEMGGVICEARLSEHGQIQYTSYTFIPFTEIDNDWMNWALPPEDDEREPDPISVLFTGA